MSINEYLKQQQPSTLDRYLNGQQRQNDKHARVAEAIEAAQALETKVLNVHSKYHSNNTPEYQVNTAKDVGLSLGAGAFRAGSGIVGLADLAQETVGNSTLGHTVRSAANFASGGEFAAPANVQRGQLGKFVEDNIVDLNGIAESIEDKRSDAYKGQLARISYYAEEDGILAGVKAALDSPTVIAGTVAGSLPSMFVGGAITKGLNGVAGAVGLGAQAAKTMSVNTASRAAAKGVTNGRVAAPAVGAAVGEGAIMTGSAREDIRSENEDGLLTDTQATYANAIGVLGAGTAALGGRITRALGGRDIDDIIAGTATKGAGRTLLGGGAGIVVEAGEEALQSTFETMGKNMALGEKPTDNLNTNVAMGIVAGGTMGAAASLGSAAPVASNAVRKTVAKINNASKENTFEEYANPENTKYSPSKAYESIKADLGSTDDTLRTAAEEKLASLDTVLAERKAQLTTTVDNMQQIIQGTLGDDGSIALPEEHAEYTQRLKVVQDELKRVQADTLDYEAAKAKHAERLRQAEGGTTVKAVEAEISTPKETGEDVVQSVAELHAQITDEELARLVETNSKVLDEVQGTAFRLLADAKISENAIKGISDVSKEVLNGKKGSTAETSNRGTREYEAIVMNGIRSGNTFAVESALDDLQSWATNYVGKSAAASEALRIVREARSTPNSGIDPVKGVQVLPDENNTWRIVTNPAEHVPEKTRKAMGGLRIHQGSTKFVKEVGLNAQHVTNVNNALAAMAEASGLSQGIQTSETVEPTTNAEPMDPPSEDEVPTPDDNPSPIDQSSSKTYTDKVVATRSGKPVHMQINRDSNGDVESIVAIAETSSKPLPEIFQGTDAEVISQAIKRFPKVLAAASVPTPPKKDTPAKKSDTPTTADTLNGIKYNTKYDLSKSLDKLVDAFGTSKDQDAHLVPLIKEFIKMLPGVKVQVFSSLEEASKHNKQWDAGNPGIYSTGSKTVLLHPNHTSTDVDMLTVLAHELAHGVTTSMRKGQLDLHVSSSVKADLADVHNVLNEYLAANKAKLDPKVADRIEYALSRPMELIAVGISEKPVREILDSIPMKDSKQSVFSKLISIAAEIFGITPKSHSALETLVRATGNAYKEQFPKEFAAWSKEVNVKPDTVNVWAGTGENSELSNLAARKFTHDGKEYLSVEHAYQSLKSGEFDQATYNKYSKAGVKIAGNKGTKTDNNYNIKLMEQLIKESFEQNPKALDTLKATGEAIITHTQDKGVWATEFPRILMDVRKNGQVVEVQKVNKPYTPDTTEVSEYTLTEEETAALAVDGSLGINPPKAEVVAEKAKPVAERNILKAHFTQSTEGNNPLVKVKDFLSVLKGNIAGITMQYMPPKYRISNAQVAHLQDFTEFATQFNDTLQKVFIERPDAYKFQDLVQFLGKDNENVNTSMAASAYSWFLQNAGNVYNDDEGIAAALHLPEGTRIPKFVRDMYKPVGQQEAAVVSAFGSKAYSILQLKADKASDARYQSRMEASMGNLIYATLLDMGLVAKVERKLFEHEKALKGIDVFNKSRHLEAFNASKAANGISKHTTFNYVRPVRNMQTLELNPRIEQMLERSKESKGILSTLFSNSIGVQFPTFEKPKGFGQTSIPRTKSVPSSVQADLVKQSQQDGFKIRTGDAKVFETLYASDKEFLHKLGGIEATDEALSSVHIAKRDDALAAAKNAQRVLDNAIDFLTMAKNEDGTYKEFWDTQHLASNSRMHYDAGGFNVQSHQTHRILAGLSSFETEVDISVFQEDELTVGAFVNEDGTPTPLGVVFLSFAENFEGMENVKMFTDLLPGYDSHTWDKVPAGDFISAMMQYVSQDYIQDAIGAVQNLLEGKELSKEEKASIQSVVDEGGMGYQSLHALTSMAQLYTAIQEGKTSYTTSVGIGSDGINNGVAIANLQAGTASVSMRLQTGIIPRTRKQELKSYQDTKRAGVPDYYTEFASQMDDGYKALTPTPKLEATRALFPSFGKRKGAKAWTIPFNYNAGFAKLRLALSNQLLDDIYGQMTKIAKLTNEPKDSVKYAEGMEMYKTFQTRLTTAGITVKLPEPQKLNDWDFGMTPSGEIDFTAQWKIMDQIMTAAEPFGEVTEAATNAMAEKYIVARNRDVVVQKAAYEVYEFLRGKVEAKFMQDMIASGKLPKGTTRLSYDSLSTEDLTRLEKALIPYGPYLRTALSANSDNDLAGGVYLGQVEQFISQAERVQTKAKVKGKDVYLNTGIKSTREMDRGVGGLALQVQSGDATVSAHTKAKAHAIGVHDADIGSPKNIDLVGKVQNETFLDMMINYHAKGETFETLLRTLQGLSDLKTEYSITDKEIATLKKQLLGDADAKSIQDSKISKFLTEQGVATQSLEEALSVLGHAAYNADMQRLDIIKDTYAVQQYGWEGSERIITDADRKLIEQRKKEIVKKANGLNKKVADIFNGPSSGTNITNKVVQNTRTLTDLQKWFGERLDKEISVSEVISEVSKEADAFGKTVLKMITPLIPKDVKVVYFNMENIPDGAKSMREDDLVRTRGWFNASTGTIYIKSVDAPNSRVNATTLIHELLHGAVAQRLYGATSGQSVEGKEAVDKLNALRTQLRETFKGNPAIERMTKNLDEFISYGLTESELQQKMQDIMVPRGNRTQGIVSMFKAFLGDLITILGFTNYRGKQVSMLQAFVTDSTQLLEAISVIPPVAIPMELHTTTDQVVSNLEAVDIFNKLPEGNVSKAHSKYLTETLDKLLQGIYKNQADARKNFTNIQVGAMAAENAGFSMSDRESYAVEAIRVAMDYYVNTHADTAMLTHIRKVYDAAKATLSPEDFTNVVWANASLQEKQLAQSKYNYLFKTTGNDYLSRFTSMVLGNEHLKTVLDVKLTEPSKKKSTWFEKLADVLSYVINSIDGKVAGAGLRTTGSKRLHDLVTSLSHIDARGRQKYLGIIDSAWSAIGMATAPLNNRGAKVVAKTLDNNFLKQSRFRILRLVGKAAAISADENLNKLPENIKKLRDQRLPNTRLGDMSEILNEVIAPNALRKMMDKFIRQASTIQQERQNIVDNTKKVVLGLFTNNGADLTKADHDALTYMLLRTDVQSLLNYRSEKGVMTLLEDPISLNRAINDITKSITTASSRGATMVNQAEMLGYYMVTGKGGNGLVKNAKGIADGLGTKSFVKDSAGVTLINQLDQLATLYALKHSSAKHKTAVKKLLSNERNGVRGMLKLHNDQVTRAKADFAANPYSINKGYVPDISNPNREINFIEDLSDREAMEKMGWVFLGEVDRDPGDKSPKRYLMVHNDKGYQRWVSGAVDLQTTNRKGTEVFSSSDIETLTLTKNRLKQDIPKFNPLKAPQGLIASYDADGLVLGYSYEMSFGTRDEYLERSNNFADLLSTYEGSLLYKPTKTKLNSEVLKAIHKDFKDNYKRNPNAYIELSPTSSDPELVKTWRMLPYEFRQEATALYGKGQPIIMNNEILNATVGFRKYSIATIWDKDKSDRNQVEKTVHALLTGLLGANAQGIVAKYGHLWGELVTFAKDAIVIRSLSVLVGNLISNILLLGLNDVNPVRAVREVAYATRHARAYQDARNNIIRLEKSKAVGGNLVKIDDEINKFQDIINRNPLKEFIEAGMLSSIVEDTMIQQADYTYMSSMQAKVNQYTSRVPKQLQEVMSWMMISPSTPIYQTFATVTQYSDFTAKYSLYKARMEQGLSHEAALAEASESFINYDMPTSKGLQYANDIGLFMFTKFFLRFQHIMMKKLETKAASTIGQHFAVEYFTGLSGVLDPLMLNRIGNNPFESGALGVPDAIKSIVTVDAVL